MTATKIVSLSRST